jgi:hypothetical protein
MAFTFASHTVRETIRPGGFRLLGRNKLPTTLGGLLVRIADHTQRHMGQAITTAKLVLAQAP